jgi:hypothetical protein
LLEEEDDINEHPSLSMVLYAGMAGTHNANNPAGVQPKNSL